MSKQTKAITYKQLYGEAGLIYLQAPAKIEPKDNGKNMKIAGNPYPKSAVSNTQKHIF